MDCNAAAARHTVADCKRAENSVGEEKYLGADIPDPLRYHKKSSAVEMTDSESPCVARPLVEWHWALAYNLCSALLCHSHLLGISRYRRDQSSVLYALLSLPQPFVMLGSSENGCGDFGAVNYRETSWWLGRKTVGISGPHTDCVPPGSKTTHPGLDSQEHSP